MNLSGRLSDLYELSVVENVCADHTVKVIVYERQLRHFMIDKSDVIDGSSFQSSLKRFEGCFRNVESHNLEASLAEKYGMTTCPTAEVQNSLCAFTFQIVCEIHNDRSGGEVSAHLSSLQASSQGCAFGI